MMVLIALQKKYVIKILKKEKKEKKFVVKLIRQSHRGQNSKFTYINIRMKILMLKIIS